MLDEVLHQVFKNIFSNLTADKLAKFYDSEATLSGVK